VRKRAEEALAALYEANLKIQERLELRERIDGLLRAAEAVLHLDRVNILLADQDGRWLEAVATLGTNEPLEAIRVPIGPEGGGSPRPTSRSRWSPGMAGSGTGGTQA